ncbi:MAG: response regulator transcription factor [Ktedonobacteraceae bacterium]
MKRVLVVEDEPQILQFLRRGLSYKGFEVLGARCGKEALQIADDCSPDLVVLDVMLPDVDGFEVCRRLRRMGEIALPILMLTARDEVTDRVAGLDCGADDYITKPFDFEELLARIRAALRRVEGVPRLTQKIQVGDLLLDTATRQAWRGGYQLDLTKREYDLLELLAQHAGQVLTKSQIFERVWGYDNEAGLEVIKVYINYLRTKINIEQKPDIIHAVRGIGYTLKAEPVSV